MATSHPPLQVPTVTLPTFSHIYSLPYLLTNTLTLPPFSRLYPLSESLSKPSSSPLSIAKCNLLYLYFTLRGAGANREWNVREGAERGQQTVGHSPTPRSLSHSKVGWSLSHSKVQGQTGSSRLRVKTLSVSSCLLARKCLLLTVSFSLPRLIRLCLLSSSFCEVSPPHCLIQSATHSECNRNPFCGSHQNF